MYRHYFHDSIIHAFNTHPIIGILGPRQSGKTTLARQIAKEYDGEVHYFDLEDPGDMILLDNPKAALEGLKGLIVIDEIQHIQSLFPLLRVLVDREANEQTFLILGSASQELIRHSSESLAGRIEYIELTPFSYLETQELDNLWIRGGFPRSYLAINEEASLRWRDSYIKTFLERDIPKLGIQIPPQNMYRFWMMLTHYHGNILNASELGRSLSLSSPTIRKYLDILTGTFMVRQLQPWFENIGKRQIKSPKIYIRDSGLLHALLKVENTRQLASHFKLGASWEGFAIEEILRHHHIRPEEAFFWGTQGGSEIDLFFMQHGRRYGFEFKYTDTPKTTKSMHLSKTDLKLDELHIIYPGTKSYNLGDTIQCHGLIHYLNNVNP